MDADNIQKCQSLADKVVCANKRDKWWNLSKLHWSAREKMGDILLARERKISQYSS
jgi:hypothetical protein